MEYLIKGILSFVFVLGAAMTIHEFGHFIVGRLLKIRVEVFSFIGLGPRVFGWKRGHTDYRLSLIPLGAYVKFGGDESNAAIEGEGASDVPAEERFDLRPRWQKFLVIVAGPAANILTALSIVFISALMFGIPQMPKSPVVSRVTENGEAARAGLRPGDRIVEFNGEANPGWDRIRNDAAISPGQDLPLIIEREGQRVPLTIRPIKVSEQGESLGILDFRPDFGNVPVVISSVDEGTPAASVGLQAGDRLISVNGEAVGDEVDVRQAVQAGRAAPIKVTVERDGQQREFTASARQEPDGRAVLGIRSGVETPLRAASFSGAVAYAFNRNLEIIRLTGNALGQVFTGKRSARETLSGPIGIGRAASRAANEGGLGGVFAMLGFLSLNLGVVNLLPIPILDGGAIALLFIEFLLGVVGISVSMAVRERIQQVGFVMLLLLMGFVLTNDLIKEAYIWGAGDEKPPASAPK